LRMMGCRYIAVGPLERATYGDEGVDALAQWAAPVFESGETAIYSLEQIEGGLVEEDRQ